MATSLEYIEFVCDQIQGFGEVRYKKMFGEYMAYINGRPVLLVCDNTVFVKILPEIAEMMHDAERGYPYDGAKEHYILDIEDRGLLERVIPVLEANTPLPRPRKKKTEAKTEK